MADRAELDRVVAKYVSSRDLKGLGSALDGAAAELAENEQVLFALSGSDVRGRETALVVATSRQLLVVTPGRVMQLPYDRILDFDINEGWRKASLSVRVTGAVADLKDIHLDRARELASVVRTARQTAGRY